MIVNGKSIRAFHHNGNNTYFVVKDLARALRIQDFDTLLKRIDFSEKIQIPLKDNSDTYIGNLTTSKGFLEVLETYYPDRVPDFKKAWSFYILKDSTASKVSSFDTRNLSLDRKYVLFHTIVLGNMRIRYLPNPDNVNKSLVCVKDLCDSMGIYYQNQRKRFQSNRWGKRNSKWIPEVPKGKNVLPMIYLGSINRWINSEMKINLISEDSRPLVSWHGAHITDILKDACKSKIQHSLTDLSPMKEIQRRPFSVEVSFKEVVSNDEKITENRKIAAKSFEDSILPDTLESLIKRIEKLENSFQKNSPENDSVSEDTDQLFVLFERELRSKIFHHGNPLGWSFRECQTRYTNDYNTIVIRIKNNPLNWDSQDYQFARKLLNQYYP